MNGFMGLLRSSRNVLQTTQVQPMKATVQKPQYKARNVTLWSKTAASIHATRDMLTAPVWGSTKPNDFISIQGAIPMTPVVVQVPSISGSNMPQGGVN